MREMRDKRLRALLDHYARRLRTLLDRCSCLLHDANLLAIIALLTVGIGIVDYCSDWMDREQERCAREQERDKLLNAVDEFLTQQRAG